MSNSIFVRGRVLLLGLSVLLLLTQCNVSRKAASSIEEEESSPEPGTLEQICISADTIHSVLISRAQCEFLIEDNKYEAEVSVYAKEDSLIYVSAVNSGFELLRALVEADSIQVIDRVNRIVYRTAVRKKFGYQNPVDFSDLQNLVSRHYLCDDIDKALDISFLHMVFNFDQDNIAKKITLDKENNHMESFEFFHHQTKKYFMGEFGEEGYRIFTNFMMGELEIRARGGELRYNVDIPIKMSINRKRYSFVNL